MKRRLYGSNENERNKLASTSGGRQGGIEKGGRREAVDVDRGQLTRGRRWTRGGQYGRNESEELASMSGSRRGDVEEAVDERQSTSRGSRRRCGWPKNVDERAAVDER